MTPDEMKAWIDSATYEELLRKWRFTPPGDPFFAGDLGLYYSAQMHAKLDSEALATSIIHGKAMTPDSLHTTASKRIGWGR